MTANIETVPPRHDPVWILRSHRRERKPLAFALAFAVLGHVALLLVSFPERPALTPPAEIDDGPIITRIRFEPPPIKPPRAPKPPPVRTQPVPFVDAPEAEPVEEPLEIQDAEESFEILDLPLATPQPPPATGPLRLENAGAGVTPPRLIESTKLRPNYPSVARAARREANVTLEAVIGVDGGVSDIRIVSCSVPNLGFEEAAIHAVRHWRYEPATQHSRPVEVYFTIFVTFRLH